MNRFFLIFSVWFFMQLSVPVWGQKVVQLEKIGKVATTKIYLGEDIFLRTTENPTYWYQGIIVDVMVTAQAIVFDDRIIPIKNIVAIKRRKRSVLNDAGKGLQISAPVPAGYELIYGSINPPIEWKSVAIFSGGTFLLGTIMRLFPPKQYKMGKKYRLRVLDLTF